MKRKSMKVPEKLLVEQKTDSVLRRTLHQIRCHFPYFMRFFFSQVNLVFELSLMLAYWIMN